MKNYMVPKKSDITRDLASLAEEIIYYSKKFRLNKVIANKLSTIADGVLDVIYDLNK